MTFYNYFSRHTSAEFLTMWFRGEGFIWHPSHHFDFEFAKEDLIQPLRMELPRQPVCGRSFSALLEYSFHYPPA